MDGIMVEFQDLGDLSHTVRKQEDIGASGASVLMPDDDTSFGDASQAFRDVLDEHYSEHIDKLADDGETVIVERLVLPSDDVPRIEYQLVEEE